MISMPLAQMLAKIQEQTGLPEAELRTRIKAKMDHLSGLISEEGAAHIIANELGVKLIQTEGPVKIKDIVAGQRSLTVHGKVLRKFELRDFSTQGRTGKVASLILGDETGTVRLVLWNEQADAMAALLEGDVLRVESAYAKDNQGRLEVHANINSRLVRNPAGVSITAVESGAPAPRDAVRKSLKDLAEGDTNIEVLGTIVQVYDPRFFELCPQCQGRARPQDNAFVCAAHGPIAPAYSYVLNIFLDDGTDNIRTVFWRQQALELLGMTDAQLQDVRATPAAFEPKKTELLGQIIKVVGRTNKNAAFDRLEFVAAAVDAHPDPSAELARLGGEPAAAAPPAAQAGAAPPAPRPPPAEEPEAPEEDLMTLDDLDALDEEE